MTTAVVDIETNGLKEAVIKNGNLLIPKATKIHCIVAKDLNTSKVKVLVHQFVTIQEFIISNYIKIHLFIDLNYFKLN